MAFTSWTNLQRHRDAAGSMPELHLRSLAQLSCGSHSNLNLNFPFFTSQPATNPIPATSKSCVGREYRRCQHSRASSTAMAMLSLAFSAQMYECLTSMKGSLGFTTTALAFATSEYHLALSFIFRSWVS
eukprot:TRINITY_DN10479_c0_g2_i1.p1 TRINITY_DN10479_c0_g2~~TRINITY_DN10479_c0_g2_i1.p1  ORF type:complete len:129 (-),score=18.47 TRINITY_DN10479_c0_g2_i1:160-546(-)